VRVSLGSRDGRSASTEKSRPRTAPVSDATGAGVRVVACHRPGSEDSAKRLLQPEGLASTYATASAGWSVM
jgi:hypothetical protein